MPNIFISYIRENQEEIDKLCTTLKDYDLGVWLDRENISAGARWKDSIRNAIKDGAYFIACFSTEYGRKKKNYMNEELMLAVDELRLYSIDKPWFIPVLLSDCDVPSISIGAGQTLLDLQWINLFSDWDLGIQKLLQTIKAEEIQEYKYTIDDLAYSYHKRRGSDGRSDLPREAYLQHVSKLKSIFGVFYDPIKLYRS